MSKLDVINDFADQNAWDTYVHAHSESRFCHLFAYRCVEKAYGYRPRYFGFVKNNALVGVLPAFETASLFFGRRLVSQPFSEYGGFLLDADLAEEDFQEIIEHLKRFLSDRKLSGLEMHGLFTKPPGDSDHYLTKTNPQSLAYLLLDRPPDELWKNVITYQVRKAVQKAERSGVKVIERSDESTLVSDFFPLYLDSMKRLGVPPHNMQYYLDCRAAFGDRLKIFWAIHEGRPISGLLGFECGKRISIINIVSDHRFWEVRPNDLIHWEYVKWAHSAGYEYFDFGSIRYEGQLQYKKKWGCTIVDHGYYHLARGKAARSESAETFNSSSGMMQKFSKMWADYVPQSVCRTIGPILRKNLVR
jgi:CelD/BcsL family acetyltransferase involved in cellulose biosynthesis